MARGQLVDPGRRRLDRRRIGDVDRRRLDAWTGLREVVERLGAARAGEDAMAAPGELDRRGAPDARACAGDEDVEVVSHRVLLLVVRG
jgi:hypothetical protein